MLFAAFFQMLCFFFLSLRWCLPVVLASFTSCSYLLNSWQQSLLRFIISSVCSPTPFWGHSRPSSTPQLTAAAAGDVQEYFSCYDLPANCGSEVSRARGNIFVSNILRDRSFTVFSLTSWPLMYWFVEMQSLHGFTWYSSEEQWKKEPAACMSHCRWPVCRTDPSTGKRKSYTFRCLSESREQALSPGQAVENTGS